MSAFKKGLLFTHRWLGFISGLVVFIVSITGCLFCFQDEIQDALHNYRHVAVQNKPVAKPSVLQQQALKRLPKGTVSAVAYLGADRPAQIGVTDKAGYHSVFLNPYTGAFLHEELMQSNFFIVVEFIHLYLLLPPDIGKVVVGVCVLIFVALMITGIVLWWPKRKTDRKRSFTIKWNGRWRRVNYDLHNVLGFYATGIALILAITGLSMSFKWVEQGIYKAGNLGRHYAREAQMEDLKSDSLQKGAKPAQPLYDHIYNVTAKNSPGANMYVIYEEAGAAGTVRGIAYAKSLHYTTNDFYVFDKHTGKLIYQLLDNEKSVGLKLNNANYDIHVGQIAGLTGKIIAFLASLICASLPITGFIIWYGKRNKKRPVKRLRHRALSTTQKFTA
jgi:uncharacterized iron-regulated membrane protein